MKAKLQIDAGICGFHTSAVADGDGFSSVTFELKTDCEKVGNFFKKLEEAGPIDPLQEIDPNSDSAILATARSQIRGCCEACAVPIGLFKVMQIAAGLALPADVSIRLDKEPADR